MKKAIVYSSLTGNTKKLAEAIKEALDEDILVTKINDQAMDSEVIFVGGWIKGFAVTPDVSNFLKKLNNKKIFIFATAGYDYSEEFFNPILKTFEAEINDTNEIIGQFICQGKVSEPKQNNLKEVKPDYYNEIYNNLQRGLDHPNLDDINKLKNLVKSLNI